MWLPFLMLAASAADVVEQNCLLQTPQQTQITGRLKLAAAIEEPVLPLKSLSNASKDLVRSFEEINERERIRRRSPTGYVLKKFSDGERMDKRSHDETSEEFYARLSIQDARMMVMEHLNLLCLVLILTSLWLSCCWAYFSANSRCGISRSYGSYG